MLRELRQNGQAFCMLYAFRGSYYRKMGWGVVEQVHEVACSPRTLPASDEARWVRRLMLPDRPAVQALYDRVAERGHFALARTPEWWNQRLWTYAQDWVVYEGRRRGQIEGYLAYEVDHTRGPFALEIEVKEVVAATPEAQRGLVGYLASLADQVALIEMAAPSDGAWLHTMLTAENQKPGPQVGIYLDTGNLANGAMLRLTDVKAALEQLPVAPSARGEVVFEVDDALLPANARAYRVAAREGRLKVGFDSPRAGAARPRHPRVRVAADVLATLMGGALSPSRAAEAGLLDSVNGGAEAIDYWFRARPAFLYPMNAF
jgi:predicted acetyltransferase